MATAAAAATASEVKCWVTITKNYWEEWWLSGKISYTMLLSFVKKLFSSKVFVFAESLYKNINFLIGWLAHKVPAKHSNFQFQTKDRGRRILHVSTLFTCIWNFLFVCAMLTLSSICCWLATSHRCIWYFVVVFFLLCFMHLLFTPTIELFLIVPLVCNGYIFLTIYILYASDHNAT